MRKTEKPSAIARIWRGRTRRDLGVQILREDREHETEFMTISYWESIEAMA
jgi:hypothetical protein